MEKRLIALKCLLDELGVDIEGEPNSRRHKLTQHAVYLAQAAGAPYGYHFGWYGSNLRTSEARRSQKEED